MIKVVISLMDPVKNIRFIRLISTNRNHRVLKDWKVSSAESFELIRDIFEMINKPIRFQRVHFNVEQFEQLSPMENLFHLPNHSGKSEQRQFFFISGRFLVHWKSHLHVGKPNKLSIGYTELVLVNMPMNVESIIKMVYNYYMLHHKNWIK